MYDGGKIITGIVVFVVLFTSPVWTNWLEPSKAHAPNLKYPEQYKQCVMSKEYMSANHMELLNSWRDMVVRQNIRYLTKDGKPFMIDGHPAQMSLTKTCLKCHDSKVDFCDQCHNYMDVAVYCWDCHVDKYAPVPDNKKGVQPDMNNQAMNKGPVNGGVK